MEISTAKSFKIGKWAIYISSIYVFITSCIMVWYMTPGIINAFTSTRSGIGISVFIMLLTIVIGLLGIIYPWLSHRAVKSLHNQRKSSEKYLWFYVVISIFIFWPVSLTTAAVQVHWYKSGRPELREGIAG